ncbi:tRNA lysidine(34) synthetase TilS [Agrobacterium sp. rho-8.1]
MLRPRREGPRKGRRKVRDIWQQWSSRAALSVCQSCPVSL